MKVIELEDTFCGMHISTACENAVGRANKETCSVHFKFNDTDVTVQPGGSVEAVIARWDADREAVLQTWINSDEYKQREIDQAAETKRKREAHMTEGAKTEEEMREATVPYPQTPAQLAEYIESLVKREHDYGTCCYSMSMAAVAAFNYVASCLGVTGFQASCADLDVLRRTRSVDGPFIFIKGADALYPQYDLVGKLQQAMDEWAPWLKEQAQKKLAEAGHACPHVIEHWKKLANG